MYRNFVDLTLSLFPRRKMACKKHVIYLGLQTVDCVVSELFLLFAAARRM